METGFHLLYRLAMGRTVEEAVSLSRIRNALGSTAALGAPGEMRCAVDLVSALASGIGMYRASLTPCICDGSDPQLPMIRNRRKARSCRHRTISCLCRMGLRLLARPDLELVGDLFDATYLSGQLFRSSFLI